LNNLPKTALFCLIFILSVILTGMQQTTSSSQPGQRKKILMQHADSTTFGEEHNPDVEILRGSVRFFHDNAYMYCDSAYWDEKENLLEAFSNVRIEQGDTLTIYSKYLLYEGNKNLAHMQKDVRMEHSANTLFTDNLVYDRNRDLGFFFDGGMLVDSINELTSVYGQYSTSTKIALFKEEVVLINPEFVLRSDSLLYNTDTKVATIVSPSVIESDSSIIYSSSGHYYTETDEAKLYDQSIIVTKDKSKTITADTLYYNRATGFGEAFGHMVLNDTVRKIILMGNYGYYDDQKKFAFATDSAQCIEYSRTDSLFLHADTLQMYTIDEERELKAFYGVRIYNVDIQGVCDSLQYNTLDSILFLYKNPILWNSGYQITGDLIKILFNDSIVERVDVIERAFAIEELEPTYFNQLRGRNLTAFFLDGELYQIDVEGNTESIYYPFDDEGLEFAGRNKTESPNTTIWIEERKPAKIKCWPNPKSLMLPIPDLNPETKFLQDFVDYNYLRPLKREDIFTKTAYKQEDIPVEKKVRQKPR
jgi:lipopolysaccharide export system protein LptA